MYDPIRRAIDIQLSGILNDFRPHNPEKLINNAIDLKYHFSELREESIIYWALQGYIQKEIAGLTGHRQGTISKVINKISI